MKSWLHSHRLRRQRSDSYLLSNHRDDSSRATDMIPKRPPPLQLGNVSQPAASKSSSRISIERYLKAPLEDEPASVPAITAALQRQHSQKAIAVQMPTPAAHSRESSLDANSDGRRTFYTSGSAPDSSGTSYSVASKTNRAAVHQRNISLPDVPELPRAEQLEFSDARVVSPERPMTSGTVDMEKTWAQQMEQWVPGYERESQIDYRARAEVEIARIQEKARELEEEMRRFRLEREESPDLYVPRVTDEMAYAQMAARPKLAWILGGDTVDAKSIERPKSDGSALTGITDAPERPMSSTTYREDVSLDKVVRKTRSNEGLDEKGRNTIIDKRAAGFFERKPSRRPKFFCTFCQKRFHSRLEWTRHEETIHMPEELWVCCPRTGEFPQRCPFCTKGNPSPAHLEDHNYVSCQKKPLSERTFNRKDHFLQHISQEHKVSPVQKPLRLTELLDAWKHPLPLKLGHQALHCGFCGKTFSTYKDRTEHVGQHYLDGLDMMSWWSARVSHDIPHQKPSEAMYRNPNVPHECNYCERTYENLATAQKLHPVCTMWSCSFLPGMQYTIYPSGSRNDLKAICCFCNDTLVKGAGRVKGSVLKDHINQHNFRTCNQRLYFSAQRFRQHLQDNHKSSHDGTLSAGWPLLLKSSKRSKPAIFEPVDLSSSSSTSSPIRRAYTDPSPSTSPSRGNPKQKKKPNHPTLPELPKMNFMDLSPASSPRSPKKLRRKASTHTVPDNLNPHTNPNNNNNNNNTTRQPRPREVRDSRHFFTRAATLDLSKTPDANPSGNPSPSPYPPPQSPLPSTSTHPPKHRPGFPISSLPRDAISTIPTFYRRRLDASTRNRLYIREVRDMDAATGSSIGIGNNGGKDGLSKNSQRLFRKVPGSLFGGLVLHSSLVGAVGVGMTNSVDVYSLH